MRTQVSKAAEWMWVGGRSVSSSRAYEAVLAEVRALRRLGRHARVISMVGFVDEANQALLLLELGGPTLDELILESYPNGFPLLDARALAADLLSALAHCHSRGVVHRDVKLGNCLLAMDGLRLCDFGHAAVMGSEADIDVQPTTAHTPHAAPTPPSSAPLPRVPAAPPPALLEALLHGRLHERLGTDRYCAPEIIAAGIEGYCGPPVDVWSAAICVWGMLSGRLPFSVADESACGTFARVAAAQLAGASTTATVYAWSEKVCPWGRAASDLIDRMLAVSHKARPSAAQALSAEWFMPGPDPQDPSSAWRETRSVLWEGSAAGSAAAADSMDIDAHMGRLEDMERVAPTSAAAKAAADAYPVAACKAGGMVDGGALGAEGVPRAGDSMECTSPPQLIQPQPTLEQQCPQQQPQPQTQPQTQPQRPPQLQPQIQPQLPPSVTAATSSPVLPSLKRKLEPSSTDLAQEIIRTCVWRGVETITRAEEARSSALKAANSRREPQSVLRHCWLQQDSMALPLAVEVEVDRPFKPHSANNNSYYWTASPDRSLRSALSGDRLAAWTADYAARPSHRSVNTWGGM